MSPYNTFVRNSSTNGIKNGPWRELKKCVSFQHTSPTDIKYIFNRKTSAKIILKQFLIETKKKNYEKQDGKFARLNYWVDYWLPRGGKRKKKKKLWQPSHIPQAVQLKVNKALQYYLKMLSK